MFFGHFELTASFLRINCKLFFFYSLIVSFSFLIAWCIYRVLIWISFLDSNVILHNVLTFIMSRRIIITRVFLLFMFMFFFCFFLVPKYNFRFQYNSRVSLTKSSLPYLFIYSLLIMISSYVFHEFGIYYLKHLLCTFAHEAKSKSIMDI